MLITSNGYRRSFLLTCTMPSLTVVTVDLLISLGIPLVRFNKPKLNFIRIVSAHSWKSATIRAKSSVTCKNTVRSRDTKLICLQAQLKPVRFKFMIASK